MPDPEDPIGSNPLSRDAVLFEMYMSALDDVLNGPEIRGAYEELNLSPATMRMRMVSQAASVLGSLPREFTAYKNVVDRELSVSGADSGRVTQFFSGDLSSIARRLWVSVTAAGATLAVCGLASFMAWPWTESLIWLGGTLLAAGGMLWLLVQAFSLELGSHLFREEGSPELISARNALMAAVAQKELLAQVRTFIKIGRQGRFGHEFSVLGIPGLSEIYDSLNRVPTQAAAELNGLLSRFEGASIGVAGARGSGKSTLIREYCEEATENSDNYYEDSTWTSTYESAPAGTRDLRCVVAAPVDYVARDFVLHLFATFCQAVIEHCSRKSDTSRSVVVLRLWLRSVAVFRSAVWRAFYFGFPAAALLYWRHGVARWLSVPVVWVEYAAITLICVGIALTLLGAWLWIALIYVLPAAALFHWRDAVAKWLSVPVDWVQYGAIAIVYAGIALSLRGSLVRRLLVYGISIAALLFWQKEIVSRLAMPIAWLHYAVLVIGCIAIFDTAQSSVTRIRRRGRISREGGLAEAAQHHLTKVRYLLTYTSGWSGSLTLPGSAASGQHSHATSRAEQPRSYPEIVADFRDFAREVAAETHKKGGRTFIGIDELDKIGSAEQAERFLNEIKGVFGIPYLYFIVSVSDDALTSFERRGLPLRNAFDSSFDEIIHVGPLSYAESRRLLYRRVVGLTEPYVALCHCLAGGLARDLIRAARRIVRTADSSSSVDPTSIKPGADTVMDGSMAYLFLRAKPHESLTLALISSAVIQDEVSRKLRAVSQVLSHVAHGRATQLQETLHEIMGSIKPGEPILKIVDRVANAGEEESAEIANLRFDFAAYSYYCATLQEVFTDQLDSQRMVSATSESGGIGTFDALATARSAFSIDPRLAWRLITQFRTAWRLETREPFAGLLGLDLDLG